MKAKASRSKVKAPRPKKTRSPQRPARAAASVWNLRLYVAGQTPRSLTAFANLKRLCEQHLPGRYNIEIVDLVKEPHRAQGDQIVALPTLVRRLPTPFKRLIGDLSNPERVVFEMELATRIAHQ